MLRDTGMTSMNKEIHLPFTEIRIGRFLFLLVSIFLMLILRPFLEAYVGISLLMGIFVTVILISGIYAVSEKKGTFYTAIVIVVFAVAVSWVNRVLNLPPLTLVGNMLNALFLAFTTIVILIYLFREREVSADVIMGGICVYLLMGLMWAFVFTILESVQPGSFNMPEAFGPGLSSFSYYSFVTITTLGYGDVTPVSNPARSLALLEAISGHLYIAILIARLVGIHIAQTFENRS
jgi:Ion channel